MNLGWPMILFNFLTFQRAAGFTWHWKCCQRYRAMLSPFTRTTSLLNMCSTASATQSVEPSPSPSPVTQPPTRIELRDKRRAAIGKAKAVVRGPGGVQARDILFPSIPSLLSGAPDVTRPFTVLGIETSCDDTGAAVVRSDGVILGEALASQYDIHEKWGGVVPTLARDAHIEGIDRIVSAALRNAGLQSAGDVDAIAVTIGPGLEICLRVGCEHAKALATEHSKPFVAVHHLEAHTMLARVQLAKRSAVGVAVDTEGSGAALSTIPFPFLALLVSGGHCQLLFVEGVGAFSIIGGTLDDAVGEAFDKVARMLGLTPVGSGISGGAAVEKAARSGDRKRFPLPVPMQARKGLDFSYAGLKNAVRVSIAKHLGQDWDNVTASSGETPGLLLDEQAVADFAASFQHAALTHLENRVQRTINLYKDSGVSTLAVVGGVAANTELRTRLTNLCEKAGWELVAPPPHLCTDNGVMVAWSGIERLNVGISNTIEGQQVFARVPLGAMIDAGELISIKPEAESE